MSVDRVLELPKLRPTDPRQRAALARSGFVHVTGLMMHDRERSGAPCDPLGPVGTVLTPDVWGTYYLYRHAGDLYILVTMGGELWIRSGHVAGPEAEDTALFEQFCPRGRAKCQAYTFNFRYAFRPEDMRKRIEDPGWNHPFPSKPG